MQSQAVTTTARTVVDQQRHLISSAPTSPSENPYTALILRDGCVSEVALNQTTAHSLSITVMPADELQRTPCAVVVPALDLNWWAICCASLRDRGLIVQPFVKRDHACTWLWFMHAARQP